jgi:hypothetical protein
MLTYKAQYTYLQNVSYKNNFGHKLMYTNILTTKIPQLCNKNFNKYEMLKIYFYLNYIVIWNDQSHHCYIDKIHITRKSEH